MMKHGACLHDLNAAQVADGSFDKAVVGVAPPSITAHIFPMEPTPWLPMSLPCGWPGVCSACWCCLLSPMG